MNCADASAPAQASWSDDLVIPPEELRHVWHGPREDESPTGVALVRVVAETDDPAATLQRAREAMTAVLEAPPDLTDEDLVARLPRWFLDASASESTPAEAEAELERTRAMSDAELAEDDATAKWSPLEWIYWMRPDERTWFWWNAQTNGDLTVTAELPGHPSPTGSLRWLLRAAGASRAEVRD
jgi:hypothetical protein